MGGCKAANGVGDCEDGDGAEGAGDSGDGGDGVRVTAGTSGCECE